MTSLQGQLEARVDEAMAASGGAVPGVAVGVLADGVEHLVTRGVTSVRAPVPVDADTLFQVGSTGKTVTALALLALREKGLLDLDRPVVDYVPELSLADAEVRGALTCRHLLTHTGGHDGDLFEAFGGGSDCLSRMAAGMHVLDQLAPLGTWSYSNAGYSLLGRVLEVLTGGTYEEAVADLVLHPLGLQHSVFGSDAAIVHRVAVGHGVEDGRACVTAPWALPRTSWPAGGLVSSTRDQLRYARFHLGVDGADDALVVPPSVRREMQQSQGPAGGGRAAEIGLSWLLQTTPGVIAHGGSANGQESAFVLVPEAGFAVTVLTNSAAGGGVHGPLVKWALREVAGVTPRRPAPRPEAAAGALRELVGRYSCRHAVLDVTAQGQGLELAFTPTPTSQAVFPATRAAPASPLRVLADGAVQVVDGPLRGLRGEFVRADDGAATWLRIMGRLHRKADD